jgi:hypothetical protein
MAEKNGTSRREFLKHGAVAGCGALAASQLEGPLALIGRAEAAELTPAEIYTLNRPENTLYTACLNCNTGCGIKVKVLDGVAVKIDGSPFNPFTMVPHLPMTTDLARAAKLDGAICPKGQAGHQGAYDPYRITRVLKFTLGELTSSHGSTPFRFWCVRMMARPGSKIQSAAREASVRGAPVTGGCSHFAARQTSQPRQNGRSRCDRRGGPFSRLGPAWRGYRTTMRAQETTVGLPVLRLTSPPSTAASVRASHRDLYAVAETIMRSAAPTTRGERPQPTPSSGVRPSHAAR